MSLSERYHRDGHVALPQLFVPEVLLAFYQMMQSDLQAAGRPVISFAAGEPDFPTPDYVVEAAVEAARDPRNHRYTAAAGLPDLREAIAERTRTSSGLDVGIVFIAEISFQIWEEVRLL